MPTCPTCHREIAAGSRFCPACGAAAVATAALAADPWIGQVVNGKFRVEALIGQGGMGRVYKALHLTLERPVVLKMLHKGLTSDPSVAQRFHREAKAASRLVHPHSIQVLDFGEAEDGTLFMAMEFLGGRDLAAVIAEAGPLPEARIVRIGAQILEALGEAHAHGIIHRDLKPENVMVEDRRNEKDHVTVLDFGIAKISDPGPGEGKLTQAGLVCGTPQYMSPEQARGRELDARSDLYSMGVILYQMATAKLPFEADTPVGFLTKHIADPPAPMRERHPGLALSPALQALVERTLAKEPADRPATADALREELLACLRPQAPAPAVPAPRAAGPVPAAGPARRRPPQAEPAPEPKKRSALPLAVGAVVVLAGGGVGAWAIWGRTTATATTTTTATTTATPTPTLTSTTGGTATAPSTGPATSIPTATAAATGPASTTPTATASAAEPAPSAAGATPPPPEPPTATQPPPRPAAAARDPKRARALFAQAETKRRGLDTAAAIALYLKAEQADPGMAEVHKKLGQCYQLQGDIPKARSRYQKYLATHPPDADRVRASLDLLR